MSSSTPRWLERDQQHAWRSYVVGSTLLLAKLDRELRDEFGLALAEYEILVRLSESDGGRMRMSALADSMCHSRSRITHTVKRLQDRGVVERVAYGDDGRGVEAVLTDAGRQLLERAAPVHVHGVRRHFVDRLSADDLAAVGRAFGTAADALVAEHPAADIREAGGRALVAPVSRG